MIKEYMNYKASYIDIYSLWVKVRRQNADILMHGNLILC